MRTTAPRSEQQTEPSDSRDTERSEQRRPETSLIVSRLAPKHSATNPQPEPSDRLAVTID